VKGKMKTFNSRKECSCGTSEGRKVKPSEEDLEYNAIDKFKCVNSMD